MTDADIDRIAERVADKLWQRWEANSDQELHRVCKAILNEPVSDWAMDESIRNLIP